MPVHKLGHLSHAQTDTDQATLDTLSWATTATESLERYRSEQPDPELSERVRMYQIPPDEMFANTHLRVQALENELAHSFRTFMTALETTLSIEDACAVAYAAGLAHGVRRLSTFFGGNGLTGGAEAMAMWQDTAHASTGARHTSALFALYNDRFVEVARTEDSFGTTGDKPKVVEAYFDGFIDGYQQVDPALRRVEEFARERPDGTVEFVHRFWYANGQTA